MRRFTRLRLLCCRVLVGMAVVLRARVALLRRRVVPVVGVEAVEEGLVV